MPPTQLTPRVRLNLAIAALVPCVALWVSCDGGTPATPKGGPFADVHPDAKAASSDAAVTDGGSADGGGARDGSTTGDARADGAADARTDVPVGTGGTSSGSGGNSGGGVSGAGAGGGNGGTTGGYPSCDECEKMYCGAKAMLPDHYTACHDPKDTNGQPAKAKAGPAMGRLKKELCEELLACVRNDPGKCVTLDVATNNFEDVSACYCGTANQDTECTSGGANGPCKTQFEAAAEVSSQSAAPSEVSQRMVDDSPTPDGSLFAIGAAANLTNQCDLVYCRVSCLGLAPPNRYGGDAGGSGGVAASASGGRGGGAGGTVGGTGGSGGVGSGSGSSGGISGGSGAASGATGGGGGSTVTYNVCRACEQTMCTMALKSCEEAAGTAQAGPATGTPRKDLCLSLVACIRSTKCAVEGDAAACYCGTASQDGPCQSGSANGPCKAQMEAAAESTDPGVVTGERFTNPDPNMPSPYAIGFANDLVGCDFFSCGSPCVDGDPVAAGTGGRAGTGGTVGTGGGGTGGVTGSGGTGGVAGGTIATGGTAPGTGGTASTQTGGAGTGGAGTGGAGTGGSSGGTSGVLVNGTFNTNAVPWTTEYAMASSWAGGKDAAGSTTSGSLLVTNANVVDATGTTMGGARQCITATGGATYALSAKLFIASGQGAGSAGVDVSFYTSADCSGAVAGEYTSALSTTTDAWMTIGSMTVIPAAAHSMAVRLVVVKTFRAPSLQAYFDNVSFARP